jgi:hypothetical protein
MAEECEELVDHLRGELGVPQREDANNHIFC